MADEKPLPELYPLVAEFVGRIKDQIVAARADGKLSFEDGIRLMQYAVRELVRMAATFADLSGANKKAAVEAAVLAFYDAVIAPIDLPGPDPLLDPLMRDAISRLVPGVIEFFYDQLPESMQ